MTWGSPGRGHPNQYWMMLKPALEPVLDHVKPAPARVLDHGKPAPARVLDNHKTRISGQENPHFEQIKPAPVRENHKTNHKGEPHVCAEPPVLNLDLNQQQIIDFDRFWSAYPKQVGKPATKRAFKKALEKAPAEEIIAGAVRYASDPVRLAQSRGLKATASPSPPPIGSMTSAGPTKSPSATPSTSTAIRSRYRNSRQISRTTTTSSPGTYVIIRTADNGGTNEHRPHPAARHSPAPRPRGGKNKNNIVAFTQATLRPFTASFDIAGFCNQLGRGYCLKGTIFQFRKISTSRHLEDAKVARDLLWHKAVQLKQAIEHYESFIDPDPEDEIKPAIAAIMVKGLFNAIAGKKKSQEDQTNRRHAS